MTVKVMRIDQTLSAEALISTCVSMLCHDETTTKASGVPPHTCEKIRRGVRPFDRRIGRIRAANFNSHSFLALTAHPQSEPVAI